MQIIASSVFLRRPGGGPGTGVMDAMQRKIMAGRNGENKKETGRVSRKKDIVT